MNSIPAPAPQNNKPQKPKEAKKRIIQQLEAENQRLLGIISAIQVCAHSHPVPQCPVCGDGYNLKDIDPDDLRDQVYSEEILRVIDYTNAALETLTPEQRENALDLLQNYWKNRDWL